MRMGGLTWFRIIVVIGRLTAIGVIAILIRILALNLDPMRVPSQMARCQSEDK